MRIYRMLGCFAALMVTSTTVASGYPSAGAEPTEGCRACHISNDFRDKLDIKMLRTKADGSKIVDDYNAANKTIVIPINRNGYVKYKLVLGSSQPGTAQTVGWLWKLPSGVRTELPNCVRRLEQGQPWTKYLDADGKQKDVASHTVAGQTFFFDGTVSGEPMVGELRVSIGKQDKGPSQLTGHSIKVIFAPMSGGEG